jgi:hypothetical protein
VAPWDLCWGVLSLCCWCVCEVSNADTCCTMCCEALCFVTVLKMVATEPCNPLSGDMANLCKTSTRHVRQEVCAELTYISC